MDGQLWFRTCFLGSATSRPHLCSPCFPDSPIDPPRFPVSTNCVLGLFGVCCRSHVQALEPQHPLPLRNSWIFYSHVTGTFSRVVFGSKKLNIGLLWRTELGSFGDNADVGRCTRSASAFGDKHLAFSRGSACGLEIT